MIGSYDVCVPCLFGLEGIVADELRELGMQNVVAENGRVCFSGGWPEIARANLWLRCGERVLVRLAAFQASTFDGLFEQTKALPWEDFIPADGAFPVRGHALNSKLMSVPDCQKIIKKAVVERLKEKYKVSWFEETGAKYQIQFSIMKDRAELFLDTSGPGLYKRGYRLETGAAPLRETLAAALVKLSRFDGFHPLYDPMCGSGTIAIEGALIAANRAPGIGRGFDAEKWDCFDRSIWQDERSRALGAIKEAVSPAVASDIDPACVAHTRENARRAGLSANQLVIARADVLETDFTDLKGVLVTNPPYGERLLDLKAARELYRSLGTVLAPASRLKKYVISSDPDFELFFGKKADKKRKLYNGMIQCNLFMYYKLSQYQ